MKLKQRSKLSLEQEAILITLLYADIFAFPLTKNEIWMYLIAKKAINQKKFDQSLQKLKQYITETNGYYTLKEREEIVSKRIKNKPEVEKKLEIAQKAAKRLSSIPTLLFVGVSGSLAAQNVTRYDDIDLFIIVKRNSIFVSRFLILLFLQRMGLRRSRGQKETANKICVNLLIDDSSLMWPYSKHDIYIAREIVQIQPLFQRDTIFSKFRMENNWIKAFMPNAFMSAHKGMIYTKESSQIWGALLSFPLFETVMKMIQIAIMKPHQTTEIVTNNHLAFHPKDYRADTLHQLKLKIRQLGLLTKI